MEQYISETDFAFEVNALVEATPQTLFLELEEQPGLSAYPPKMMLKIILYAYTQSVFSGRKIEFLLDGSYLAINRFRSQETTTHFR